jgi:hypothetical protein
MGKPLDVLLRFSEFYPLLQECENAEVVLDLCKHRLLDVTVQCLDDDEDDDEYENVFKGEDFYVYTYKKGYGEWSFRFLLEIFFRVEKERRIDYRENRYKYELEKLLKLAEEERDKLYQELQNLKANEPNPSDEQDNDEQDSDEQYKDEQNKDEDVEYINP